MTLLILVVRSCYLFRVPVLAVAWLQLSKANKPLSDYVSKREVLDVLQDFSSAQCRPEGVLSQLRPLQPRYYSIASSPMNVSRLLKSKVV